jgi:hypothetical protein
LQTLESANSKLVKELEVAKAQLKNYEEQDSMFDVNP